MVGWPVFPRSGQTSPLRPPAGPGRYDRICPVSQNAEFFGRDTPTDLLSTTPDRLEDAAMTASRGIPGRPAARSSDDPTVKPRVSMAQSVAAAARSHATARRMTVARLIEHLIQGDDVDRDGRPRWAVTRPKCLRPRRRSNADPTRQVHFTLARSVHLTGRAHAAAAGMTFSGYIEQLIRRELQRHADQTRPRLDQTA